MGFLVQGRDLDFCRKLRLHAARRILEFSLGPRHVSQHCVQPLRSQYHEAERNHEQDFSAESHKFTP